MKYWHARGITIIAGWIVTTGIALAQAVATPFDLDGNGTNETIAGSTRVATGTIENTFYDTISVNQTLNPGVVFTGLTFDWELPGSYRFKGGLPVGKTWSSSNSYSAYATPFEFNYTINLTPTGCPANSPCPAVTKTAVAWTPLNLEKSLKSIKDLFGFAQVGGQTQVGNAPEVMVWAKVTDEGSQSLYQYYALNFTGASVDLSWTSFISMTNNPVGKLTKIIAPGAPVLLDSFLSPEEPFQVNGLVTAMIDGQEQIFIAPSIAAGVPEFPVWLLLFAGMAVVALRIGRDSFGSSYRSI